MDGDTRRPQTPQVTPQIAPRVAPRVAPQVGSDYQVHADYEMQPAGRLDAQPSRKQDDAEADETPDKPTSGEAKANAKQKTPMPRWKKLLYWVIGLCIVLALIITGVLYWRHSQHYASTDDAFVEAHISQISARVSGRVSRIRVDDNEHVLAGDVLVEIDPSDLKVGVDQANAQIVEAQAKVQQAEAQLGTQQAAVDQARAQLRVTQADLQNSQQDANRYRSINPQAVSRQAVDTAAATLKSSQARVDSARQAVTAAEANVSVQQAQIDAAKANLKTMQVGVENAKLQLSYTTIVAPQDGQVARKTVQLGNYITPGQALMAVVGDERWVTANFKETQLADMKQGQPVSIDVDACPDHGVSGTVNSIQPGSGSIFSSLPAENATGNYVKVVQRVPVKITIKHEDAVRCIMAPGMSVVPTVTVR